VNKMLDVERFLTERVILNEILCFYSIKEISKNISCSYEHTRRLLQEMEKEEIVVRHPCNNSYRISREHYLKHYVLKEVAND